MQSRIRIGNQTAISSPEVLTPFEFALQHGFDAFEWFADKKESADGRSYGWDEADMTAETRAWIRDAGTFQPHPLHRTRAVAGQSTATGRCGAAGAQPRLRP